ncbi:MAG: TRAP transporter large permease [Limnochordia bacterium]|nr:TRAP transporter large permease [Bacillota bacterium]
MSLALLAVIFLVLIGLGVPIAVVLLGTATLGMYTRQVPLTMLTQTILDGVRSYTLLAIPFYIMAGELMNRGGITKRIFDFALSLVGHIKGGLGHVNVLASMLFAGISGSATADAAGLGRIEIEAMKAEGYDLDFSAAITAASSTIGPIIPPSIHLVIYGSIAEVPVATLFTAGMIPGILMGLGLMFTVYILAATGRVHCPTRPRQSLRSVLRSLRKAGTALLAPVLVLGGIMTGVVTPTEAGVIAVVYSLVLGLFYREINKEVLVECIRNTIQSTAVVMFMLAVSRSFAWFITIERIPDRMMGLVFQFTESPAVVLFFINILLLLLGMIGTASANIVIVTPILVTIAHSIGVDLIHLGLIIVLGLMIGLITPPVGTSLYILSDVASLPFERVVRATLVFVIPLVAVLYLVTYIPSLSLFLPRLLGML